MSEFLAKRITMRFIRKFQIKRRGLGFVLPRYRGYCNYGIDKSDDHGAWNCVTEFFWICCFLTVFHEYSGLLRRISRKNQSAVLLCFDTVLSAFIWNDEGAVISSGDCAEHSHYNRGSNGVYTFCEVCAGRKSEQENP